MIRKALFKLVFWLSLASSFAVQSSWSEVVTAEGRSAIVDDIDSARQNALEDAIRNALLKVGSRVESSTDVENGVLVNDWVRLQASGQVRHVEIVEEYRQGDFYTLIVQAEIGDSFSCGSLGNPRYNKSVLFTAFPRELPDSARVGQLNDVDVGVAKELAQRLYSIHDVIVQTETSWHIDSGTRYLNDGLQVSEAVRRAAQKYQVQYIVSGSIVDMSMLYAEDYSQQTKMRSAFRQVGRTWKKWTNTGVARDVRDRMFAFRLRLYDGLSGEYLFDKLYEGDGIWDAGFTEATGFGSPRFWSTNYGGAVSRLLSDAVDDVGQKINCQPFMLPVRVHSSENVIYLPAGANNGINVGDTFELHTQEQAPFSFLAEHSVQGAIPSAYKQLRDTADTLTVTQVYPTHSVATASVPLEPSRRYLAIAWNND